METVSAILERPRAAAQEWSTEGRGVLLLAAFVVVAAFLILSERRRAGAQDKPLEGDVPFALRDLELTPEAAEDLTERLVNPSALPTRPLRGVAAKSDPTQVA